MTQKEKLIELIGNFTDDLPVRDIRSVDFDEKFAEFLIENGVSVPECKIGDTVCSKQRIIFEDEYCVTCANFEWRGVQEREER